MDSCNRLRSVAAIDRGDAIHGVVELQPRTSATRVLCEKRFCGFLGEHLLDECDRRRRALRNGHCLANQLGWLLKHRRICRVKRGQWLAFLNLRAASGVKYD